MFRFSSPRVCCNGVSLVIGALLVACVVTPAELHATERQKSLEREIASVYTVTDRNSVGRIKRAGTILVLQKEGLRADVPKPMMKPTEIRDGEVVVTGSGSIILGSAKGKALHPGEKLYLLDVRVRKKEVVLLVATTETYVVVKDGKSESTPYEAALAFKFDAGTLETASASEVLEEIGKFVKSEEESAIAETRSIELGQSTDEVKSILGQPGKVVDLGEKTIYVHDDLKVIFINGKVADVE